MLCISFCVYLLVTAAKDCIVHVILELRLLYKSCVQLLFPRKFEAYVGREKPVKVCWGLHYACRLSFHFQFTVNSSLLINIHENRGFTQLLISHCCPAPVPLPLKGGKNCKIIGGGKWDCLIPSYS